MFKLDLEWKSFNLDMNAVEIWMKANAGSSYCGNQANVKFELWFSEEPSEDIKAIVKTYWDGLTAESAEALSYKSKDDRKVDVETKKASGKAKLAALGLSAEEIAALVG